MYCTLQKQMKDSITGVGLTLIGVVVGLAATIVMGIENITWWQRLLYGILLTVSLLIIIKLLTQKDQGPLSKLARWTLNAP